MFTRPDCSQREGQSLLYPSASSLVASLHRPIAPSQTCGCVFPLSSLARLLCDAESCQPRLRAVRLRKLCPSFLAAWYISFGSSSYKIPLQPRITHSLSAPHLCEHMCFPPGKKTEVGCIHDWGARPRLYGDRRDALLGRLQRGTQRVH